MARELIQFLQKYNKEHPNRPGIGLAANQLGIDACVCIVALDKIPTIFINPTIISRSADTVAMHEGCLSFPGVNLLVRRNVWVKIQAENMVEPKIFGLDLSRVSGKTYEDMILESACVQHETDHILGITIFDRAM